MTKLQAHGLTEIAQALLFRAALLLFGLFAITASPLGDRQTATAGDPLLAGVWSTAFKVALAKTPDGKAGQAAFASAGPPVVGETGDGWGSADALSTTPSLEAKTPPAPDGALTLAGIVPGFAVTGFRPRAPPLA